MSKKNLFLKKEIDTGLGPRSALKMSCDQGAVAGCCSQESERWKRVGGEGEVIL